jgi:hypothetical protein
MAPSLRRTAAGASWVQRRRWTARTFGHRVHHLTQRIDSRMLRLPAQLSADTAAVKCRQRHEHLEQRLVGRDESHPPCTCHCCCDGLARHLDSPGFQQLAEDFFVDDRIRGHVIGTAGIAEQHQPVRLAGVVAVHGLEPQSGREGHDWQTSGSQERPRNQRAGKDAPLFGR